jgi:hypothetical protein
MQDDVDLYDFPADHVGRKHYVSVSGHVRSVPKYKTYLGSDSRNHILPEYGGAEFDSPSSAYYMPDKQPYQSPMDGSYVTSRSQHREHMRKHNVLEAGDIPRPTEQRNRDVHARVTGRDIADSIKRLGGH